MKRYEVKQLPIWSNQIQTIWLPDFSEIVDISLNQYGSNLDILCKCSDDVSVKQFNIWISELNQYSTNISPPSESYQFFNKIERTNSSVSLGLAMNGRIEVENYNTSRFYIFIEEIKTMAENRDNKLEEMGI